MTHDTMTADRANTLAIRERIEGLLGNGGTAEVDRRLYEFAGRVLRVIAGEPDPETDEILAEELGDHPEPWRYDMRAERLDIVLGAGASLVDGMREEQYASLPQEVRDADDAASAAAAERRAAFWATLKRQSSIDA